MSTRGFIGYKNADGKIFGIYSHYDNYITGNGKILLNNYKSTDQIEKLFSNGWICSLGPKIDLPSGMTHNTLAAQRKNNVTVYYGRDLGRKMEAPIQYDSIDDFYDDATSQKFDAEVIYFHDGSDWKFATNEENKFYPLNNPPQKYLEMDPFYGI